MSGGMLTVLLAARDAERTLPEVLDAYRRQAEPVGGWRLVVVDNGSRDGTRDVLASRGAGLPLHVVDEPRPGQNRARNAAWPLVTGDLVVLTDADTVPSPRWLACLRAASDAHPEVGVFAGPVRPRFTVPPSPALRRAVRPGPTWAVLDGETDGEVDPLHAIGPNLAIRVAALPPAPVFDEGAGPDGTPWFAMGAETSLLHRLRRAGVRGYFVGAAHVDHVLPPEASTASWVLRRAVRYGRGRYRLGTVRSARRRIAWGGVPLALRFDLARRRRSLARALASQDEAAALAAHWDLCYLAGQALGALARSRPLDPEHELRALLPAETRARLVPEPGPDPVRVPMASAAP